MSVKAIATSISAIVFSALPGAAQEQSWRGQVTPYVWGAGLAGDITPFTGAPTFSVDKSLSEVLEDTDGAFFFSGYARRDRLVLMGDLSLSSSSKDGLIPPGLPATAKLRQRSMTLLGGYRAVDQANIHFDALVGVRLWRVEGSVDVAGGAISRSGDKSFTDPVIAFRANYALTPRLSTIVYADFGGFNEGSDNTSQIVATLNYQVSNTLYVSGGYRQLSVDYSEGGTQVDMTMAGPLLGMTLRF
ncbi:MAG: hypothetical protein MEQ74_15280 [Paracoccus sp.]|nr:hypothetical protein [Paracoccus sp. (in: a-proteobacteria)]